MTYSFLFLTLPSHNILPRQGYEQKTDSYEEARSQWSRNAMPNRQEKEWHSRVNDEGETSMVKLKKLDSEYRTILP